MQASTLIQWSPPLGPPGILPCQSYLLLSCFSWCVWSQSLPQPHRGGPTQGWSIRTFYLLARVTNSGMGIRQFDQKMQAQGFLWNFYEEQKRNLLLYEEWSVDLSGFATWGGSAGKGSQHRGKQSWEAEKKQVWWKCLSSWIQAHLKLAHLWTYE